MAVFLGAAVGVLLSIAAAYVYYVIRDRAEELTAKIELKARLNADLVTGKIFDDVFWPALDEYNTRIDKLEKELDETTERVREWTGLGSRRPVRKAGGRQEHEEQVRDLQPEVPGADERDVQDIW